MICYGSPGPLTLICGMGGGGVPFSLLTALLHFRTGIRLSPCDLHASILWKGGGGGGGVSFLRERSPYFLFLFFWAHLDFCWLFAAKHEDLTIFLESMRSYLNVSDPAG